LRGKLGIRWCYCLWLVLLIRMAMPWSPQSRVSMFNLIPQSVPQRYTKYAPEEVADESVKSDAVEMNTGESAAVSTARVSQDTSKAVPAEPVIRKEAADQLKPGSFEVANVLPLLWLTGALVLAVYVCAGNFHLWWLVTRQRPLTDQDILDLLEDCKSQMGIRTILGLVVSDKVKSPALFGFIRPRLLLPAGIIETLSREELRYVFLHELAHLKRHDIYVGYLSSLLQVLHWFNPLIWLAFYRMWADRELACDALVLARTQSSQAKDYGRTY
ncbi:MAG: M56 family metallopeptidase, partial [Planctomycetota bacterium]